jgi:hypothetical protein
MSQIGHARVSLCRQPLCCGIMTEFCFSLQSSNSSASAPLSRIQSSVSGCDSPRSLVADELFNLHISSNSKSDSHQEHILSDQAQSREVQTASAIDQPRLTDSSPQKQSPLRRNHDEMEVDDEDTRPTSPAPLNRPHSHPLFSVVSDVEDNMDKEISPPDELTRYFRQKRREEQIAACRLRELREEREARVLRRNKSLSPKPAKVRKSCTKRVRFVVLHGVGGT